MTFMSRTQKEFNFKINQKLTQSDVGSQDVDYSRKNIS